MRNQPGARGLVWLLTVTFMVAAPASASAVTFTVNTTNDTVSAGACAANTAGQCSLREAVIESNAAGGSNTINVPAGTYQLTRSNTSENGGAKSTFDSQFNELDVETSTVIAGAGAGSTIIEAGTDMTNGIGLIFIVNGFTSTINTLHVTLSGMTMRYGRNLYSHSGTAWGFGGAVEFEGGNGSTLTLDHDTITDNSTTDGSGGGVAVFDDAATSTASGTTISNSTISNNVSNLVGLDHGGDAGGVFAGSSEPLFISNSTISGNSNAGVNTFAGGIETNNPQLGSVRDSITNTLISDNSASIEGAGAHLRNPTDITGDTFTGNPVTAAGGDGGGLWSASIGGTTVISPRLSRATAPPVEGRSRTGGR